MPGHRRSSAVRPTAVAHSESLVGLFNRQDRRHVAVVITTDGRRVPVPMDSGIVDVSLLGLLRSLVLGLEDLLGLLITGSRRENGGTRRDGRS
jgi:hypothetical protein